MVSIEPFMHESTLEICWFCKRNRHDDCIKKIPLRDQMGDCSFGNMLVPCLCVCNRTVKI